MDVYFKIGELSEMFDVSVRALHLYDKMGLLKPEYTDDSTNYRYYTTAQIEKLNIIQSFKKVGFSLSEIKKIYDNNFETTLLLNMLKNKSNHFKKQKDIIDFNIENINRMIKGIEASNHMKDKTKITDEERAMQMSRIICIENLKMEDFFSGILWL